MKRDLSKKLIPKIKIEDIPDKPLKQLLSSPHKPVVLRNYHAYTVGEYKWLDKGMSPSKTKMNYEAYKGPVGEMKVESSFGKPKSWSTSKSKQASTRDFGEPQTSDLSSSQAIARTLNFHENGSVSAETRKTKTLKTSKSLPYAKRNEERKNNKKTLSLTKYELSKRARRLNYKPILDKPHQKIHPNKRKEKKKERP